MKVLVVGAGKVGSEIARDLAVSPEVDSVTSADASRENLKRVKRANSNIRTQLLDISQKKRVDSALQKVDIVCGALPGRLGFQLMKEAAEVGIDLVDISYTPQDPFRLDSKARRNDSVIVPQCGVAPGLSNMCVGDASRTLGRLDSVKIFVGGLPQKPEPPLNYRVVFSLEDVINEYSRPVNVIENGRRKLVQPLTSGGIMTFPGVGRLEYFLTDGLGSLPRSFPRTREMYELTLRYPGHADIMETLRVLGFFSQTEVEVNGVKVAPRSVSLELLRPEMSKGRPEDLLALKVTVTGYRSVATYEVLDFYDRKKRVSAMARTTAYPCTSVAVLIGRGRLDEQGVVTPEKIARDQNHFGFIVERLRDHGIKLRTRWKRLRS
jgi:lysine 6-dehydrogenase